MEQLIKRMLRKRLKKRLGLTMCKVFCEEDRRKFEWVYNAPLTQWRDRIWVCKDCMYKSVEECDNAYKYLTE